MGDDIIDLTKLQKMGILRRARQKEIADKNPNVCDNGIVDFTQPSSSSTSNAGPSANPLASFFGSSESTSSSMPSSSSSSMPSFYGNATPSSDNSDVSSLRIKIEDTEYKLERALERINELERKLSEIKT